MCRINFFIKKLFIIDQCRHVIFFFLMHSLLFFSVATYAVEPYGGGAGRAVENPMVEIQIETNQSMVPVNSTATFSLLLQPGESLNAPVDLWLLRVKDDTIYHFDVSSMQFVPGLTPTYQGNIIEFNRLPLPVIFREAGGYAIYFAVDTIANGQLDGGQGELFYSATSLTVQGGGNLITYIYNGDLHRIHGVQGASPENISEILNTVSSGEDSSINVSPNGAWYLISSERFHADCSGWACLMLSSSDFSQTEVVITEDSVIHNEGAATVDSTGNRIVYSAGDGVHYRDLWMVTREGDHWSAPLLLTKDSPFQYNNVPAISDNGDSVLFECGNEPYENKAVCESNLDASGFRVLFAPDAQYRAARTPDYSPDGTIVVELDSIEHGESIFRIVADTGHITPVNLEFTNDNSPCVLGDGRIASLWLNREGSSGVHELKIMEANGSGSFMLLKDIDLFDEILGCASW